MKRSAGSTPVMAGRRESSSCRWSPTDTPLLRPLLSPQGLLLLVQSPRLSGAQPLEPRLQIPGANSIGKALEAHTPSSTPADVMGVETARLQTLRVQRAVGGGGAELFAVNEIAQMSDREASR